MNSKLRIVLIVVAALLLLLILLPYVIPVNQFRPTIEQQASAALGRKVEVGNLSFSLLGGSLTAENLSISDDAKFSASPFLTAKSLKVVVEIFPLIFSKSLNVRGITIVEPVVTLLRNPAGQWNYSSLAGAATKPSGGNASPGAAISIAKLDLKDGRITIGTTSSQKRSTYDHVDVKTSDISNSSKFPLQVSTDLPGGGKFKLEGTAGPLDATDAALTPIDAKLTISSMNLAASGVVEPSAGLGGLLDLEATIVSQGGDAVVKGTLKLSKAVLAPGGSPAAVPVNVNFDTKYDLRKNSGVLNPSTVSVGKATTNLSGSYSTTGEIAVVNIKASSQNMPAADLVAFLPALGIKMPNGASLEGGTLNTNLTLAGPTNRLVTSGNVGLFSAKLANFDLGSKMSGLGSLAGVKSGKDLEIEKFTSNVRMAPEGLKADDVDAVLPAVGTITGAGTLDVKNELNFKMAVTLASGIGAVGSPVSSAANGLGGAMGKGNNSSCKSGTTVPFLIQGTTTDPRFVPDAAGLAGGMIKSQAGCAAGLVTGAGKAGVEAPVKAVTSVGGLFGKKKP